jgi:hypothetical protein
MVAKPVATPAKDEVPAVVNSVCGFSARILADKRRQLCLGQAGEVMATGFEVRTIALGVKICRSPYFSESLASYHAGAWRTRLSARLSYQSR